MSGFLQGIPSIRGSPIHVERGLYAGYAYHRLCSESASGCDTTVSRANNATYVGSEFAAGDLVWIQGDSIPKTRFQNMNSVRAILSSRARNREPQGMYPPPLSTPLCCLEWSEQMRIARMVLLWLICLGMSLCSYLALVATQKHPWFALLYVVIALVALLCVAGSE